MDGSLATLITTAGQAPSGDNTQPWRFVVDPDAGTIALEEVASRDRSPMNAGRRMSRIAVGAALENLIHAARGQGWAVELERSARPLPARVRLTPGGGGTDPKGNAVAARVTNRHVYDGCAVPGAVLDRLSRATPDLDGVGTRWIVGGDRLKALARLIGRADAAMFGEASMRHAFLSKVRLDTAPGEPVAEGLSLSSLELSPVDRWALRAVIRTPDRLLKLVGVSRVFAAKARRLVSSASGLCLIVAPDVGEEKDVDVGRAMQRAWLTLTAEGLAVQPMMSLLVLENVCEHGDAALLDSLGRSRLAGLRREFRSLVPEIGGWRPAFLMRFGFAPAPSGRTGRLPLHAISSFSTASSRSVPSTPGPHSQRSTKVSHEQS